MREQQYTHFKPNILKDGSVLISEVLRSYPQSEKEQEEVFASALCKNVRHLAKDVGVENICPCGTTVHEKIRSAEINLKRMDKKIPKKR
jgi:hypothetical protein